MDSRYGSKQLLRLVYYKSGFDSDMYIQIALIHFYDQMGYAAYKVFDKMPEKDVVSMIIRGRWTVYGCLRGWRWRVLGRMNDVTVLRACAETGALSVG
ncbi:hypothetical protein HanRHA438_Chr04g0169081 [Helianthus annuus]|uniref:Pentatricopeptide repeat protein n=1 Tax=Helianthus annuus TaxID=4232 RepID=A0A251UZ01_HELAN|nr:hypothetical protein HanXRQr2_Chr04g0158881 [Helianthus annuus]KAJ0580567.1 hypothetical protein HanHA300_Chr04g0130691 [Helianthus annuus]KAJ0588173.1 hypothetical protein HanIR_Chr04g0171501 [Helianthus annuus]KAJ0596524.1 hypothetical protein HanHA89_Chr04g0143731 [Helianthus annuus]KAJ0757184.1 hypothetical protein HanLR1_Chr04g0135651 [Helianthus annuus]